MYSVRGSLKCVRKMKLLGSFLCAILLAGVADASNPVREINREAGDEFTFTATAVAQTIASCILTKPDGDTMTFFLDKPSEYERFELLPITSSTMPSCSILLTNLQKGDSGLWKVAYVNTEGTGSSQQFQLDVNGTAPQDPNDTNDDDVIWLETIDFPTRTDLIIDISLPKSVHEEKCTVRTPDGNDLRTSELNVKGVTKHDSSNFVSCRITIGPMEESLLGEWALCGTYTENGEEHVRCQPVKIYWNNENHPGNLWHSVIQPEAQHPVHFGKTLTPVVIGIGDIVTCHVVTPNGEDLVIREGSEYPGIKADTMANSICGIAIGPIDKSMLHKWTVYGLFRSVVMGLNEEHLPLKMFLYDEDNPYNQAYNVTTLDPVRRMVNLGNTLNIEFNAKAGEVNNCYFETPSGDTYDLESHESFAGASFDREGASTCRVTIGPITKDLLGNWTLTGKFRNNNLFTEIHQTFQMFEEDPENPIEEDRTISYLTEQTVETEIGNIHRIVITQSDIFTHAESCHIRTPDGRQYKLMEGFNVNGIEVLEEPGVECGVIVNVVSEDVVGDWILIARATRLSGKIERRLPFTIYVEESVEALINEITITEGDDLVVRLKNPTNHYESCRLIGPFGHECQAAETDPNHVETCGFIRRDAQTFNTGTWTITFGNRIVYKAEIFVTVNAAQPAMTTLDLIRDRSVERAVGPENAVYCRLEDPQGFVVFENFGRCILSLNKVELEHQGAWKMLVGEPNRVVTEEYQLYVNVRESGKAVVTTHVEKQRPIVIVACSVQTDAEVKACKFRDPQGRILLATSGVSEDRYQFYGSGTSGGNHECGFRITEPLVSDLGLWRCAIETANDTYYGHMPVLCPWALSDPAIAATVQQEPLLTTDRSLVNVVEDEPAVMSCSIQSAIRYCYFRTSNGTTFTVSPGTSSSVMDYVGAGFDAGECGIRFHGMSHSDGGRWSCHVGLVGDHDEQRAQFQLTVHERMSVNHFIGHGDVMTVEGVVYEGRALEYCRFVRIDGFGFTTDNVPPQYTFTGILNNGECQFTARNPTMLDLHPWTVVARIRGQDVEIAKDTMDAILVSPPPVAPEKPDDQVLPPGILTNRGLTIFFYLFLILILVSIILGVWLGPKKHREWTHHRASAFRRSFSSSFRKTQPTDFTANNA